MGSSEVPCVGCSAYLGYDNNPMTTTRTSRRYDYRLRNLVRVTQDITWAVKLGVPPSTARGWLTAPDTPVVTAEFLNLDATRLQQEVLRLRRCIQKLTALLRILLVVFRISGYSLNQARLPDGHDKRLLLRAIEQSRSTLPLRALLRVLRLSPSRFYHWKRDQH